MNKVLASTHNLSIFGPNNQFINKPSHTMGEYTSFKTQTEKVLMKNNYTPLKEEGTVEGRR